MRAVQIKFILFICGFATRQLDQRIVVMLLS